MWRDISLANRNALLEELQQYQQQLTRLQMLLANADGEGMLAMFTRARDARNHWLTEILGSGKAE